jgi:hypothetical protein
MTNEEWIRSLSGLELVIELGGRSSLCEYIQDYYNDFCIKYARCDDCVKAWLAAEHTEPKEGD